MNIVYGSELSKELRNALKEEINKIEGRKPCLAVVLVGENPASVSYVRGKNKALNEAGMECRQIDLKEDVSEADLLSLIEELNNDDKVDGAIEIIKANAKKRVEKEPTVPPTEMGEFFTPIMVDVLVGGATVFVVDVDRFEKI